MRFLEVYRKLATIAGIGGKEIISIYILDIYISFAVRIIAQYTSDFLFSNTTINMNAKNNNAISRICKVGVTSFAVTYLFVLFLWSVLTELFLHKYGVVPLFSRDVSL